MRNLACHGVALALGMTLAGPGLAQSITDRLAEASPDAGERLYRQCQSCHTIDNGGPNRAGPNLFGIVGHAVATRDGFRYSSALTELGGDWTVERLDAFLENPREFALGTRMSFRGLADPADRAAVIAYLNSQSDAPLDFGGSEASEDSEAGDDSALDGDFGLMFVAEGVDVTYYACTSCHSEMIVVQQGKTRDGWDHLLDWMVAEQGMMELETADREIILDYLAEHYNTDRPNFPQR